MKTVRQRKHSLHGKSITDFLQKCLVTQLTGMFLAMNNGSPPSFRNPCPAPVRTFKTMETHFNTWLLPPKWSPLMKSYNQNFICMFCFLQTCKCLDLLIHTDVIISTTLLQLMSPKQPMKLLSMELTELSCHLIPPGSKYPHNFVFKHS
jgi:hypothetical protein